MLLKNGLNNKGFRFGVRMSDIIIYNNDNGDVRLKVNLLDETVWLTQEQISVLYGKAKSTINEHIKNIFRDGELIESESLKKFGISEFQQKVPNSYNLDVIISVGYRARSLEGTKFRSKESKKLVSDFDKDVKQLIKKVKNNGTNKFN